MLSKIRNKASALALQYEQASLSIKQEQASLASFKTILEQTKRAQEVLQGVAQQVQQEAHRQIASLVSRCLEAVFEEPYEFQINFDKSRGKTEANLVFVRDGAEVDPATASGGGVIDVAAFALRLAVLMLSRPKLRRLLVLDEPLKYLSANYRPRMAELMDKLSEEMDLQLILVSHDEEFQFGKVVRL